MKVLIIEDERYSAERLAVLIKQIDPDTVLLAILESVADSITWFNNNQDPDVLFLDIHLADTNSFDLFKSVQIDCPIIFTTAFHEYALQAFKVNSIDYLLKPIDKEELKKSIDKLKRLHTQLIKPSIIQQLNVHKKNSKERFLVKKGSQFISILSNDIAQFISEDKLTRIITFDNQRVPTEHTLDELTTLLDSTKFYRINRHTILNIENISKINSHFNGRLKLETLTDNKTEQFVSRDRVNKFKEWLNN